jgi:hypothetical protein
MSDLKFGFLIVLLLTCLAPWIFTVWWWPCNLYVSISTTFTAVTCFVYIALVSRQPRWFAESNFVKPIFDLIILLFSSSILYGLFNGNHCHPIPYYISIAYVTPISITSLILVFIATIFFVCILTYTRTSEEEQDLKNFQFKLKLFSLTGITCVCVTWLPMLWVFTCDTLPLLPISSTCFSVVVWIITLGGVLKHRTNLSINWRYIVCFIEYFIMSFIFGICIYLNFSLLVDNTTCYDGIVTYSLVLYIFFGIFLSTLTFWYFLLICLITVNSFLLRK